MYRVKDNHDWALNQMFRKIGVGEAATDRDLVWLEVIETPEGTL